ncbi:ZP3 protein, partial [Polypterus senegalus]|nr:ZP3 protein [Polypterus senegalus]
MRCKGVHQFLLAIGLFNLYFYDVSAAFGSKRFRPQSKAHKAIVIQSEGWAQQRAGSPQSVSAQCTETEVIVSISSDLFGIRHPVQPSDLTLGGCGVTSQVSAPPTFVIEASLQECGNNVTMLPDEIVYNFTLEYNPSLIPGIPIMRTNPAVVQIECHYPRNHNVSSNALNPTWVPYTSTISAEDILGFSLDIMNRDWSGPSSSNTFYLGDFINLQASVDNTNHVPLRIFVDNCVASPASDGSAPTYTFIGNHGCFIDRELTNSSSQFITPRVNDSILQFELDAFRFYGVATSSTYTALVNVVSAVCSTDGGGSHRLNQDVEIIGNKRIEKFPKNHHLTFSRTLIMGCKVVRTVLLAVALLNLYFYDVSAAFGSKKFRHSSKAHKAVVIQSEGWAQQRAGSAQTVSAQCTETEVIVNISSDLFGIRHPVQPSDLTLGGCGVTSQVSSPPTFVIEAPLQGCNSNVTMLTDEIVYSFTLEYNPSSIPGIPIMRTNPAVVLIECHYSRNHNVSSNALNPTWVPYNSTISAEDILGFSLDIMNSDWSAPRSTNTFYLGDLINLQASVDNTNHVPLRIFVDNCVASPASDGSAPTYTFIGNHGCFTDGQLTNSSSQFITPRVDSSTLQFELDAFRFYDVTTSSMLFTLEYNPSSIPGIPIMQTNPAVVQIECHYPRNRNVSSKALNPTWVPYTSTVSAEDILGFSLDIMNSTEFHAI